MNYFSAINIRAMTASVTEERRPDEVCRTITFRGSADVVPRTIRYLFQGDMLPEPLDRLDFALVALVFQAMRTGDDLHIEGPVSRVLLSNLEEFQVFWTVSRPGQYHRVRLTADTEVEPAAPVGNLAVLSYSGGMDANFTMLQHLSGDLGRRTRLIATAVLVHGFDLRLSQTAEFACTVRRARANLDHHGIPLTLIETDWRSAACGDWPMEHGAGLASCLGQFAGQASAALIASGEDYASILMPWGCGPVVNPLLGFGDFEFLLDGCSHSRSEKAAVIAQHPAIMDSLRVCWQATQADGGNCGRCEKCLRSKMNFMANGIAPGASLQPPPTFWQIARINARNAPQLGLLQEIIRTARHNGLNAPWLLALRLGMTASRLRIAVRRLGRPVKRSLKSALRLG